MDKQDAVERPGVEQDAIKRPALEQDAIKRPALEQDAIKRQPLEQDAIKRQALEQDGIKRHPPEQDAVKPRAVEQNAIKQPAIQRIVGFIEILDESGFHGWAYDKTRPAEAAKLQLHIDDVLVCTVPCEALRKDVAAAGHPRDKVGFHAEIPQSYFDDAEHFYRFTTPDGEPVSLIKVGAPPRAPRTFKFSVFFNAEFYRRFYPDARGMTDLAAFNHWARTGATATPRHPNQQALFTELADAGQVLPDDFSPLLYRYFNPGIAAKTELDWEAAAHYLMIGRDEGNLYNFTGNSFLVDLYFGGVTPPGAELDAFLAQHRKTVYTSLDDLLQRNGIVSDTCLRLLNVADYVSDNMGLGLRTKMQCIRHFAETGLAEGRALAFDSAFDPEFVAAFDPDYADLRADEAYLQWINAGAGDGVPPNQTAFLRDLGLSDPSRFPDAFDAGIYLATNPELTPVLKNKWSALRHFIEQGLPDGKQGCPISPDSCDIYRAAADRLAVANRLAPARRLYETLLAEDRLNVLGNRHYADCLLRQDEPFLAARVYEDSIASGGDNIWTHLNLTTCYIRLRRWADACATMQRICALRQGDRAVQRRYRDVMKEAYAVMAAEAQWLAANGFNDRARLRIRQACDLLTAPIAAGTEAPSHATAPVRSVAIIADIALPQCKFYRVDQKIEQLESSGIACKMIDYRGDIFKFVRGDLSIDAVILYRVPATPDVAWCIWLLRQAGIPVFFEIDDLMFDAAHFPDSFESYGGQISRDLYATLINGSVSLAACMSVCDYALASTPSLARMMQDTVVSGRAFVHRNSLSKLHQDSYRMAATQPEHDKVRIFYGSGTRAHNEDFDLNLAVPLAKLLKKWGPRLEVLIMGYLTLPPGLRPYSDRITVHAPVWDLRAYWSLLQEVDISLAVLKPGPVADCKSEIKWLEAAMLSVPSVVSATQTYVEVIEDGKTGLLVKNSKDWFAALDGLIGHRAKRIQIGQTARETVMQSYSLQSQAANLTRILDEVTVLPAASRKRILIVHVFYPPQSVGGATRVVSDNVHDLLANYGDEFDVQIFTTLEGGAEAYVPLVYMSGGVKVIAVPTPSDPEIDRKVSDPKMAAVFERVVEQFKPDLVHLHCIQRITPGVCEVLRLREIPYVVTVHDGWWISESQFLVDDYGVVTTYDYAQPLNEFRLGDARRLERMKVKQEYLAAAERVLAVSEPFTQIYRKCGFTNVITVANGVSDLVTLPRVPSADGRVRMAHIGGASFHKGYHLVRTALCRGAFSNLHLLVIDHAMDPAAVRHAKWGETEVTFRGKFSQSKVAELYQEMDVLLAPSVWPESYGLVAREATQSGCWVVASDRGAIGQDLTPEHGFVIDVSSCDALSAVFAEMNSNPAKYLEAVPPIKLRKAADQAADLVALYRLLLGGAPAAPVKDAAAPLADGRQARPRAAREPASGKRVAANVAR